MVTKQCFEWCKSSIQDIPYKMMAEDLIIISVGLIVLLIYRFYEKYYYIFDHDKKYYEKIRTGLYYLGFLIILLFVIARGFIWK